MVTYVELVEFPPHDMRTYIEGSRFDKIINTPDIVEQIIVHFPCIHPFFATCSTVRHINMIRVNCAKKIIRKFMLSHRLSLDSKLWVIAARYWEKPFFHSLLQRRLSMRITSVNGAVNACRYVHTSHSSNSCPTRTQEEKDKDPKQRRFLRRLIREFTPHQLRIARRILSNRFCSS